MTKLCVTHKLTTATLALWSPKGGVGKTTTAVTLARLFRKHRPTVVDLDEQQATAYFAGVLRASTMIDHVPEQQSGLTIIDCPDVFEVARPALRAASLIVVPVACKMLAYGAFMQWYDALQESGQTLPVRVLLTMYQAAGLEKSDARAVRNSMAVQYPGVAFDTVIPQAAIIAVAAGQGRTVLDFAPEHRTSQLYQNLGQEIAEWHLNPPADTRAENPRSKT